MKELSEFEVIKKYFSFSKNLNILGSVQLGIGDDAAVLAANPKVALAAVGKQIDDLKGEIAKAYIVLKEGEYATEEEIIAFCRKELAAYKCPRKVQFVKDVPKTSTGKIMRRDLSTLDHPS